MKSKSKKLKDFKQLELTTIQTEAIKGGEKIELACEKIETVM